MDAKLNRGLRCSRPGPDVARIWNRDVGEEERDCHDAEKDRDELKKSLADEDNQIAWIASHGISALSGTGRRPGSTR